MTEKGDMHCNSDFSIYFLKLRLFSNYPFKNRDSAIFNQDLHDLSLQESRFAQTTLFRKPDLADLAGKIRRNNFRVRPEGGKPPSPLTSPPHAHVSYFLRELCRFSTKLDRTDGGTTFIYKLFL